MLFWGSAVWVKCIFFSFWNNWQVRVYSDVLILFSKEKLILRKVDKIIISSLILHKLENQTHIVHIFCQKIIFSMILIWIKIQYACKADDFQQPLWPSQSRLSRRFILCYKLVYANTYETKNRSCYASLFQASTRPSHCLTYTDTSFSSPKTWIWSFCFLEHQSLPETNVKKQFQFLLSYWYHPLQEVCSFYFQSENFDFFGAIQTRSRICLS